MKKKTGPKPDGIERQIKSINLKREIGDFILEMKTTTGWSYSECVNKLCVLGMRSIKSQEKSG